MRLEGSIAITGALVQWLRDNLGLIELSAGCRIIGQHSVADNGGIYFVPAFSGLYAPYWRNDARGSYCRHDALRKQRAFRPGDVGGHCLSDA